MSYRYVCVRVPLSKFSVFLGIIHIGISLLLNFSISREILHQQKRIDYSTLLTAEGWHGKDSVSREISRYPHFPSPNNRAETSSPISLQQLLSQTSISSIIVTGQGGTWLQTLLSSLNSRLLILTSPHNSPSISIGFGCGGWSWLGRCLAGSS